MTLPNNLTGIQNQIKYLSGNIAAARAQGGKEQQIAFNASYADNGNVSYVEAMKRINIAERGPLVATGHNGDIALSKGNGMFIFKQNVTDAEDGAFRYKSTASLRTNKEGYLSTSDDGRGYKLYGYKFDENGNLPTVTSLLSSLVPVNVQDVVLKPEASTIISVNRLRLDSNTTTLHGPGDVINVNRGNLNANLKIQDIIIPEENNFSGLKQGDTLSLLSNPPGGVPNIFEYGGIVISKKINSGAGGFYGRTTTGGQFTFSPNQSPTNLVQNNGIAITFNGNTTNLRASTDGTDQTFNSLEGLKDAINTFVPGLTASISDGRIFIAPDDTVDANAGNRRIQFANTGGGNFVSTLGLIDTEDAAAGVTRFATLKVLQNRVNINKNITGLKADFIGSKLDLHALIASSTMDLGGSSRAGRAFARATIGKDFTPAEGGQARGRATITIESPKHDLKQGDKLWIDGINAPGFYMVNEVHNNDSFTISVINNNPALFPVAGAAQQYPVNPGASWRKIASESFQTDSTSDIGTLNNGNIQFDLAAGAAPLAIDDVVYISGIGARNVGGTNIEVPDGYYIVQAHAINGAGVQNIAITPSAIAGAQVNIAARGFAASITKVGSGNGGNFTADNFNSRVFTTGAAGTGTVRMYLHGTNYNVSDSFRLSDLPDTVIDGITLNSTDSYNITAKDPQGNWIDFTVPVTAGVAAGGGQNAVYGVNPGNVPTAMRINDYGLTSKYLGLKNQAPTTFGATYSQTDPNISISNMTKTSKHKDSNKVFETTIKVTDSLGDDHTLLMSFARLEDNRWTIEFAGVPNKDGSYDFVTARSDGVIAVGELYFDERGSFSNSTLNTLQIDWTTNGSATSSIAVDWNDILSGKGVIQARASSFAEEIKPNGHTIGTIINFEIDEDGVVYAVLDNGERISAYQLAIAVVPNINGMDGAEDGFFVPGADSGTPNLHLAGVNGAPTVLSKVIEGSNIAPIDSILKLNEVANDQRANIAILTIEDHLTEEAIKKVGA